MHQKTRLKRAEPPHLQRQTPWCHLKQRLESALQPAPLQPVAVRPVQEVQVQRTNWKTQVTAKERVLRAGNNEGDGAA